MNLAPPLADLTGQDLQRLTGGPWGWPVGLPFHAAAPITLGEGGTPMVRLHSDAGHGPLWVKNEAANPTWSHKDRAMSVAATYAAQLGAKTVVATSSGNAGASAAAYAARAGLRCVVLTTTRIPPDLFALITSLGAVVAAYERREDRHTMLEQAVDKLGWTPVTCVDPLVGGPPVANEGFKSIAYELARDLPEAATVVVPTARADLLSSLYRGYAELTAAGLLPTIPRLVAAEPDSGASFTTAMSRPERADQERVVGTRQDSPAFSIGNDYAHWQGLQALWETGGTAIAIGREEYLTEYRRVPAENGLFVEASSAVGIAAARRISRDTDTPTVAINTSSGLKDVGLALELHGAPEPIPPGIDNLERLVAERAV